jgi:hypothetical protein
VTGVEADAGVRCIWGASDRKKRYIYSFDEATRRITMMRRFDAGLMSVFGLVTC